MSIKKLLLLINIIVLAVSIHIEADAAAGQREITQENTITTNIIMPDKTSNTITKAQAAAKVSRKVQAKSKRCTKKNIRLLASIIYCEAGNQSYSGKLAVGIVVMNRVRSSSYPNTVKGVIYQKSQFGPVSSGLLDKTMKNYKAGGFTSKDQKQCIRAAKQALNGIKAIKVKNKRKVFSNYYGFNNVKPSCSYYKLGGHYFRK